MLHFRAPVAPNSGPLQGAALPRRSCVQGGSASSFFVPQGPNQPRTPCRGPGNGPPLGGCHNAANGRFARALPSAGSGANWKRAELAALRCHFHCSHGSSVMAAENRTGRTGHTMVTALHLVLPPRFAIDLIASCNRMATGNRVGSPGMRVWQYLPGRCREAHVSAGAGKPRLSRTAGSRGPATLSGTREHGRPSSAVSAQRFGEAARGSRSDPTVPRRRLHWSRGRKWRRLAAGRGGR